MEEIESSPHEALLDEDRQETPNYTRTPYFRHCVLFALVVLAAGLIPFGLLSVLEEFQTIPPSSAPSDDHHHHEDLPSTTTVVSPPSPSAAQVRPDLPERALTEYVNTLIGTAGFG